MSENFREKELHLLHPPPPPPAGLQHLLSGPHVRSPHSLSGPDVGADAVPSGLLTTEEEEEVLGRSAATGPRPCCPRGLLGAQFMFRCCFCYKLDAHGAHVSHALFLRPSRLHSLLSSEMLRRPFRTPHTPWPWL